MHRKEFNYKLNDGKEYIFSERSREDINFLLFQDKVRKAKIKFAEENVSDEGIRDAIIIQQMDKIYDDRIVSEYIATHPEEIEMLVYASFKIKQPEIDQAAFGKLVDEKLCRKLLGLINELESPEPVTNYEIKQLTKISQPALDHLQKNQPDAYEALRRSLKKKPGKASAAK